MGSFVEVFSKLFNEFRKDKIQLIFFFVWAVVTLAWPTISGMGFGEPDNWDYPRQIAPALGIVVAGGAMTVIFALVIAKHRENGDWSKVGHLPYFLGIGSFYGVLSIIMAIYTALVGTLSGRALVNYLLIILLATICAMLIGTIIGLLSKDSKTALTASYPVGLALVLLFKFRNGVPAFQMINPIRPFIDWFYMERANYMLVEVRIGDFAIDVLFMLGNIAVLLILLVVICKIKSSTHTK